MDIKRVGGDRTTAGEVQATTRRHSATTAALRRQPIPEEEVTRLLNEEYERQERARRERRRERATKASTMPPPPTTPPRSKRGVVKTLVCTLLFHVFAMLNGLLMIALLGLTLGGLALVLLCTLSASTRSSRLFVAWLWRNELWLNGLVSDEKQTESERLAQERERGLRRAASQRGSTMARGHSASSLPTTTTTAMSRSSSTRGREVTPAVMVFSIIYFLLFKGLFNVMFATVPLLLWGIVVVHVAPSLAPDAQMVLADDTTGRAFVALTTSFFAYQIGVAAASVSVSVSEKIQGLLFHRESTSSSSSSSVRAPLLAGESVRNGYQYSGSHLLHHERPYLNERDELSELEIERVATSLHHTGGDGGGTSSMSGPPPPPVPSPPPPPPLDAHRSFGTFPPTHPMPGAHGDPRRPGQTYESAFQAEPPAREVDFCGIKVTIQRSEEETHRGGGRGRGGGSFRGGPHRGGRGGMGRGDFYHPAMARSHLEPPPSFGTLHDPFLSSSQGSEVFARIVTDEEAHAESAPHPPMAMPAFGRRYSNDLHSQRHGGGRRHGRHRRNSFDSVHTGASHHVQDFDLKHGAHTRLWEALDLRPGAPSFLDEYAVPRSMDHVPLSPALNKSRSDTGHHQAYADDSDTPEEFRKFELVAAKRKLKEQSRQLKEAAKRLKQEYKARAKRDARAASDYAKEQSRYAADQERYAREYAKRQEAFARQFAKEEERRAKELGRSYRNQEKAQVRIAGAQRDQTERENKQADSQREQAGTRRERSELQQAESMEAAAMRAVQQQLRYQTAHDVDDEGSRDSARADLSASYLDHKQAIITRDEYAMEIEQAAQEEVERQRKALEEASAVAPETKPLLVTRVASNDSIVVRGGRRIRNRRPVGSPDNLIGSSGSGIDDREFVPGPRRSSSPRAVNTIYQTGALSDHEIQAQYGSLPRHEGFELNGHGYGGMSLSASPALIRSLDDAPLYRGVQPSPSRLGMSSGHDYDPLSPLTSPTSSFMTNSFIESRPYDQLSPTNSLHDADFPSEEFQQVFRSIRYTDDNRVVPSQISSLPHFEDVPGARDKVHFCSYAPPSVYPSKQSFRFSIWAFLLTQRHEVRERAEAADPETRQLSINTKMVVRRGAIVHVTLEAPEGFKILNGATQGFPWEGKISNVAYDIECTENADFGQVLFKASIVVGTEVSVLRSYVIVSSRKLEPSELEAKMLDSQLEVLDMTYQEIPYPSLELKEFVGSGYFGDAYRASYNGEDVVVKTIRASEFGETNDQILKEFQHEAAVLSMFGHHPCVVPFVGASTDLRYPLSLITKYLPFGNLEDNLKNPQTNSNLSTLQRTRMLKDAAAGLLNIHEGGFIHRDVAARNCLVDRDQRVKICDFGLCRRVNAYGGSLVKDSVGPIKYMAPESLQPPHSFSYDSDSWMFGVLMWETYTATPPFHNKTPIEAGMAVLNGERLPVPQDLPLDLQSLMESCFSESPSQRPSMDEILTVLDKASAPKIVAKPNRAVTDVLSSIGPTDAAGRAPPRELGRHDVPIWV